MAAVGDVLRNLKTGAIVTLTVTRGKDGIDRREPLSSRPAPIRCADIVAALGDVVGHNCCLECHTKGTLVIGKLTGTEREMQVCCLMRLWLGELYAV